MPNQLKYLVTWAQTSCITKTTDPKWVHYLKELFFEKTIITTISAGNLGFLISIGKWKVTFLHQFGWRVFGGSNYARGSCLDGVSSLGGSKIWNLGKSFVSEKQDILRLHVSVSDPEWVHVLKTSADADANVNFLDFSQTCHVITERPLICPLHDDAQVVVD